MAKSGITWELQVLVRGCNHNLSPSGYTTQTDTRPINIELTRTGAQTDSSVSEPIYISWGLGLMAIHRENGYLTTAESDLETVFN